MKFYNTIFQKSWQVTKRNKVLWLFGFFMLFWTGKGIDMEVLFSNANLLRSGSPFQPKFWNVEMWADMIYGIPAPRITIAIMVVAMLALGLFVFGLIVVSQIALAHGFATLSKSRSTKQRYTAAQALKVGQEHFLPVAAVNIIGKLAIFALVALVASPLFLAPFRASQFGSSLLLFFILLPLTVAVSIMIKYAVNEIVLKGSRVGEAMRAAWVLFSNNIGVSLELALFMLIAYVLVIIGAVLMGALLASPVLLFGIILLTAAQSSVGLALYYLFAYVAAFLLMVLAASVFITWQYGNWTLLYLELTKGNKRSKVERAWSGE